MYSGVVVLFALALCQGAIIQRNGPVYGQYSVQWPVRRLSPTQYRESGIKPEQVDRSNIQILDNGRTMRTAYAYNRPLPKSSEEETYLERQNLNGLGMYGSQQMNRELSQYSREEQRKGDLGPSEQMLVLKKRYPLRDAQYSNDFEQKYDQIVDEVQKQLQKDADRELEKIKLSEPNELSGKVLKEVANLQSRKIEMLPEDPTKYKENSREQFGREQYGREQSFVERQKKTEDGKISDRKASAQFKSAEDVSTTHRSPVLDNILANIVQSSMQRKPGKETPLFPAGEMVTDMMLERYDWHKKLMSEDIKNFTGIREEFLNEVVNSLQTVTKVVNSPTTLTVLYMKAVMEEVLNERLKCPSVVLDKILVRMARNTLDAIKPDYDHYMLEYFTMLLSGYLELPELEKIVEKSFYQLDNEMYYQLMHYIVSRHLGDVYTLSHQLFPELETFFKNYINGTRTEVNQLATIIKTATRTCNVKCPIGATFDNTNKYVYWDLVHQFLMSEGSSMTFKMEAMIFREVFYIYAKKGQPFPEGLYQLMGVKMHPTTLDHIQHYIGAISSVLTNFERFVMKKDAQTFMQYVNFVLEPSEVTLVRNVTKTLGWKMHREVKNLDVHQQIVEYSLSKQDGSERPQVDSKTVTL